MWGESSFSAYSAGWAGSLDPVWLGALRWVGDGGNSRCSVSGPCVVGRLGSTNSLVGGSVPYSILVVAFGRQTINILLNEIKIS